MISSSVEKRKFVVDGYKFIVRRHYNRKYKRALQDGRKLIPFSLYVQKIDSSDDGCNYDFCVYDAIPLSYKDMGIDYSLSILNPWRRSQISWAASHAEFDTVMKKAELLVVASITDLLDR